MPSPIVTKSPYSDDGYYPGIRAQQNQLTAASAVMMKDTPMYQNYLAVAPNADEFPRLLDALGTYMRQKYDWSAEVSKLKPDSCWCTATATCSSPNTWSRSISCSAVVCRMPVAA